MSLFSIFKKSFFLFIFLFVTHNVFSQSLLNQSKDKFNKIKIRSDDIILFSIKSGYHTGYEKDREKGFNGGLIYSGNVDASVTEQTYVGLSFEYWHHTDDNYNSIIDIHSRTFTGTNFSFNFSKRFKGDYHSINLGLGGGMYFVKKEDKKIGDSKRTYFNIKLLAGFDIRIVDIVWISPQMEYNNMINFDRLAGMFSFKIGPTIMLNN